MHKEFAVEPEAISSWTRLQLLSNCIGFDKGRLISGCPSAIEWYKSVHNSCREGTAGRKGELVQLLAELMYEKKAVTKHRFASWTRSRSWVENVVREEESPSGISFDGIVVNEDVVKHTKIVDFDSLTDANPIWRSDSDAKRKRNESEIVEAARTLLKYSAHIVFVDPYFDPQKDKSALPLKALLNAIFEDRGDEYPVTKLECHLSAEERDPITKRMVVVSETSNDVETKFTRRFAQFIPQGISLYIWRWKRAKDKMHPRYILTDMGGIRFDHGLDTGEGTTDISRMSEELRKERWKDYITLPAFDHVDKKPIIVPGQGPPR